MNQEPSLYSDHKGRWQEVSRVLGDAAQRLIVKDMYRGIPVPPYLRWLGDDLELRPAPLGLERLEWCLRSGLSLLRCSSRCDKIPILINFEVSFVERAASAGVYP